MTLVACFLLGSVLAYGLVSLVYRLHLHPLSKFPGPRLAAVTGLYEIYFSVWGVSSFDDEIERMHQEYGKWPTPYTPPHREVSLLTNGRPRRSHYSRRGPRPDRRRRPSMPDVRSDAASCTYIQVVALASLAVRSGPALQHQLRRLLGQR